jgi:S-(hydroxymethyl)mycothiol dehydrogenase
VTSAAVYDGAVSIEEIEVDAPGPGEVLVRLRAAGVCHSDLHVLESGGWGMPLPVVLGHEAAAVVEELGEGVEGLAPGDPVVLAWRSPCGECAVCARGEPRRCPRPLRAKRRLRRAADGAKLTPTLLVGAFSERAVVHAGQAVKVHAELPPEQACLLGCAVATGVGAVTHTTPVWRGARVAVIGCGGVGLAAVQGARIAGAAEIVAIDPDERKHEAALRFGATRAVADPEDVKVDLAYEAVGRPEAVAAALAVLDHGGTATMIGVPKAGTTVELALEPFFDTRATLRVSHGGDHLPAEDFPWLAGLALRGELDLAGMVTRTIRLEEVEAALDDLRSGHVGRTVVVFD